MTEQQSNRGIQIMLFTCMVIGGLLIILTCIWKLVKIVAMYKMESRIEDLEALSSAQNNGAVASAADISSLMSPKEARHLRKLSILAGFEKKWSRSQRSSISGHAGAPVNANRSFYVGRTFRNGGATSPMRKVAELLSLRRSSSNHAEPKYATTSNGRVAPNFLNQPPPQMYPHPQPLAVSRGFIKDCLSPNEAGGSSREESPVLGHKAITNCAIHGTLSRPPQPPMTSKVSTACQTVHPPPPAGFDEDEDCISPPNSLCFDSPMSSEVHPAPMRSDQESHHRHHQHHVHQHFIQHEIGKHATRNLRCINPNHYHHHHHHHEPPTIKLTHNPISDDPEAEQNNVDHDLAALLFHPPQYNCVICQHNASLYRALSNPSIFSSSRTHPQTPHHHIGGSANLHSSAASKPFSNINTTMTSTLGRHNRHNSKPLEDLKDSQDGTDQEDDIDAKEIIEDIDDDDDEVDEDEELPITPPPKLELKRHRLASYSSIKDDIYSDPKSNATSRTSANNSTASVHWNSSTIERQKISDN